MKSLKMTWDARGFRVLAVQKGLVLCQAETSEFTSSVTSRSEGGELWLMLELLLWLEGAGRWDGRRNSKIIICKSFTFIYSILFNGISLKPVLFRIRIHLSLEIHNVWNCWGWEWWKLTTLGALVAQLSLYQQRLHYEELLSWGEEPVVASFKLGPWAKLEVELAAPWLRNICWNMRWEMIWTRLNSAVWAVLDLWSFLDKVHYVHFVLVKCYEVITFMAGLWKASRCPKTPSNHQMFAMLKWLKLQWAPPLINQPKPWPPKRRSQKTPRWWWWAERRSHGRAPPSNTQLKNPCQFPILQPNVPIHHILPALFHPNSTHFNTVNTELSITIFLLLIWFLPGVPFSLTCLRLAQMSPWQFPKSQDQAPQFRSERPWLNWMLTPQMWPRQPLLSWIYHGCWANFRKFVS